MRIVLWGHKLHSNTYSYIHYGIKRAFESMGREVLWLDDSDDVSGMSFSNCIFFTEGQVDHNIPLDPSSKYVLHNCVADKYPNHLNIQVCRATCPEYNSLQYAPETERLSRCAFFHRPSRTLFQPWATDLLPKEIDPTWAALPRKQVCHWVGTIGGQLYGNEDQIAPFKRACEENWVQFIPHAPTHTDTNMAISLIQESCIAPAIHGRWQLDNGYANDRLMKNISYGQLGVTNSKAAQDLFEGRLVYNSDEHQLFHDALPHLGDLARIREAMAHVTTNHTYINRVATMLSVI